MDRLFNYLHLIATGVLIGKVVLLSFVVAPTLAQTLDAESFGNVVRRLFIEPCSQDPTIGRTSEDLR